MKRCWWAVSASVLASAAMISAASAQVDAVAIAEALSAAMEKAEAEAARAGDDALSCEQMLEEIDALINDPTVKEKSASLEARAREEIRRAEITKSASMAAMAGRAVLGAAVAGRPEATLINLIAGYVQMAVLTAQATAAAPRAAAMRADLESIMPQFGRTMRLTQLAQDKDCAFMRPSAQ